MRGNYRLLYWMLLPGLICSGQENDANTVWKGAGANEGLRQAFEKAVYRLKDSGPGRYQGINPAQRLALEFNCDEARLKHSQGDTALRLTGYGFGERLRTPLKAKPSASGNRVEYQRGELSEWYVNDSRGLEQGFTLARRPGASRNGEPLVIALGVSGELRPELAAQGDAVLFRSSKGAVLRYAGLRAWDARGRALASRLQVGEREVRLVVEDRSAEYPLVVDPVWTQTAELIATDGAAGDEFGWSVAASGDTAVVGAYGKTIGSNPYQGAAYVFVQSGATWIQQAELNASDGAANDALGWSASVSGDTAVVGASGKTIGANTAQGAAYVFVRSGATWIQQAELNASDGAANDAFGWSVSVSGDTAVVGALRKTIGANTQQGAAYVFVRNGTTWSQQQELPAPDAAAYDGFGNSVAVNGDTVAVGAFGKTIGSSGGQGAAYVFVRSGATWSQQQELTASDGVANDGFGWSVSVSGDTAAIGACFCIVFGMIPEQSAAYVFVRNGVTWSQQQELAASDGAAFDVFGVSVSVSGDTAVVGAGGKSIGSNFAQGAAYVFVRNATTWSQQQEPTASNGAAGDEFGWSVSVSGDTAVVGAWDKTIGGNSYQGTAYVFTPPTIPSPTISKGFGAASIPLGGTTSLTFTIANPNPNTAFTGLAFSDNLPAGLVVATPNALMNMCAGTPTATAGASSINLAGGTLAANTQCTVVVNVTGTAAGMKSNVTENVSSNEGGVGNTASAGIIVVAVAPPPKISKGFGAASIPLGGTTSLTFTIANPNPNTAFTGLAFSDNLPAGLVVATPNALMNTCGGTPTASAGNDSISLTGGTLAANAQCTVAVNVTGTAVGMKNNVTGNVSSNEGGVGDAASAGINVVAAPPTIDKAFGAASIQVGWTTSLTFTIANPNPNTAFTGLAFSDNLPAGLVVAAPNALMNMCGGTSTATAGSSSINLAGGTLAANTQCTVVVNVTGNTAGVKNNVTENVSSNEGGVGNTASANLLVVTGVAFNDFAGNGLSGALLYDPSLGQSYTALSNGNGTYTYVPNLFTAHFDTLRTGDFNGDGKADLILYNSHTALAYIGMGNGDGTFNFQSLFWSPGYDTVVTGDINGDGKTDVALYNSATGTLYTGISNGDGAFTYEYHLVSENFTYVKLADTTGDGKADLLLYRSSDGVAYLGIGDGTGAFAFNPLLISPGYNLADTGDLNGDSKADIILYNATSGNAATGISNGSGGFTFTPMVFLPGFTSVRPAHYTGHATADLTVYNKNTAAAYFGTGNGDGTFNFQSLFWSPGYDNVVPEDVNGDGKTDILLYNSTTGTEYTGISNGDGIFTYTYQYWGIGKVLAP